MAVGQLSELAQSQLAAALALKLEFATTQFQLMAEQLVLAQLVNLAVQWLVLQPAQPLGSIQ